MSKKTVVYKVGDLVTGDLVTGDFETVDTLKEAQARLKESVDEGTLANIELIGEEGCLWTTEEDCRSAAESFFYIKRVTNIYDEMNLQFATQKICAPSHAVEIDPSKDINYYETLCLYCAENDVNLDGVNDVEFEADADQIQHFSLGEDGIINERFWFWVETNNFEYEEQVL